MPLYQLEHLLSGGCTSTLGGGGVHAPRISPTHCLWEDQCLWLVLSLEENCKTIWLRVDFKAKCWEAGISSLRWDQLLRRSL